MKLQKKYWSTNHKFGINVPILSKIAYKINNETGTDFWRNYISKKMLKVNVIYIEKEETTDQIWSGGETGYIDFQEITCHPIFDANMDF